MSVSVEEVVAVEVWDEEELGETARDCILDVMEEVASDSEVFFRDDGLDFCFFVSGGL